MAAEDKKILVADDETHILHVVSLKLRNAGFNVLTARDGQEALELAQSEHPDLIITDYHMPQLSGLELCQRLKQDPRTSASPPSCSPPAATTSSPTTPRRAASSACSASPSPRASS